MVAKRNRRDRRKNRIGLTHREETKLKVKIRETVPSEPWLDSQFTSYDDIDPKGQPIVYRFHTPKAFPPPAENTPMVVCALCGRHAPSVSMETPLDSVDHPGKGTSRESRGPRCMDCRSERIHRAHGKSPSAAMIQQLQYRNLRLEELKMEPESIGELMEEIRRVKVRYIGEGPCPFLVNFSDRHS